MELSESIRLERPEEGVGVLRMDNGENRFTPEVNDHVNSLLDQVDDDESIGSLVVTGSGKFFSNGFDIDALTNAGDGAVAFVGATERIWARLMAAPYTVVTAVNGHAFGAGAMLALAGDLRVGRTERGFWCLPEADLGMPFSPAMMALFDDVLGRPTVAPFMATSARVPPEAQLEAGIVQRLVDMEQLDAAAIEMAKAAAHRRGTNLGRIKKLIHGEAISLAGRA